MLIQIRQRWALMFFEVSKAGKRSSFDRLGKMRKNIESSKKFLICHDCPQLLMICIRYKQGRSRLC